MSRANLFLSPFCFFSPLVFVVAVGFVFFFGFFLFSSVSFFFLFCPSSQQTAIMAEMTAAGFVLGAGAVAAARAFDSEHLNLSARTAHAVEATRAKLGQVDAALGLSHAVGTAGRVAGATAAAVDAHLHLSEGVAVAASAVKNTAAAAASAAMAVAPVRVGVEALASLAEAVSANVSQYTAQTAAAIERRTAGTSDAAGQPQPPL